MDANTFSTRAAIAAAFVGLLVLIGLAVAWVWNVDVLQRLLLL